MTTLVALVNLSFQDSSPLSLLLKTTQKDLCASYFSWLALCCTGPNVVLVALRTNSHTFEFAGIPPGLPEWAGWSPGTRKVKPAFEYWVMDKVGQGKLLSWHPQGVSTPPGSLSHPVLGGQGAREGTQPHAKQQVLELVEKALSCSTSHPLRLASAEQLAVTLANMYILPHF